MGGGAADKRDHREGKRSGRQLPTPPPPQEDGRLLPVKPGGGSDLAVTGTGIPAPASSFTAAGIEGVLNVNMDEDETEKRTVALVASDKIPHTLTAGSSRRLNILTWMPPPPSGGVLHVQPFLDSIGATPNPSPSSEDGYASTVVEYEGTQYTLVLYGHGSGKPEVQGVVVTSNTSSTIPDAIASIKEQVGALKEKVSDVAAPVLIVVGSESGLSSQEFKDVSTRILSSHR